MVPSHWKKHTCWTNWILSPCQDHKGKQIYNVQSQSLGCPKSSDFTEQTKHVPTVVFHSCSCLLCGLRQLGRTDYKHEQLHNKVFGTHQRASYNSQRWSFLTWTVDSAEQLKLQKNTRRVLFCWWHKGGQQLPGTKAYWILSKWISSNLRVTDMSFHAPNKKQQSN